MHDTHPQQYVLFVTCSNILSLSPREKVSVSLDMSTCSIVGKRSITCAVSHRDYSMLCYAAMPTFWVKRDFSVASSTAIRSLLVAMTQSSFASCAL